MRDPNKLSHSEAGKLGYLASIKTVEVQKEARRRTYYNAPVFCQLCNKVIPYEKKGNKFCSQSCNAIVLNHNRYKSKDDKIIYYRDIKPKSFCLFCNTEIVYCRNNANKYCNNKCQQDYKWKLRKQKLIEDGCDTVSSCKNAKRYIIETRGHSCEICKGTEWYNNPMPLTLDHINGNPDDHSLINLRVICPNCDRLTPNFGSKNRGNGRASRRQRYQDGKSY